MNIGVYVSFPTSVFVSQKPYLKCRQEARGGAVMPYHSTSFADPQEEIYLAFPTERRLLLYYSAGGRKNFPCLARPQPMRDCHNSVIEKPLHFKVSVSSNGLIISLPNSPFSSVKNAPLLCSPDLPVVLHRLHVPNCNSLLLLNKPILLVKIPGCFIVLRQ